MKNIRYGKDFEFEDIKIVFFSAPTNTLQLEPMNGEIVFPDGEAAQFVRSSGSLYFYQSGFELKHYEVSEELEKEILNHYIEKGRDRDEYIRTTSRKRV